MLIIDGVRYKPWTPKDEEKEFHPLVKAQSKEIFGKDTIYFDVKTTLRTSSGVGSIPDAYVVDFTRSEWFVVENELSTHPVYNHIIPQLNKFMKGIENANVKNQILDLLYDEINSNLELRSVISRVTANTDIHNSLSKIIVHKSPRIVVIIDEKTEEVEEAFENFKTAPVIVEFRTFEQEANSGVYAHLFEPLYSEDNARKEWVDKRQDIEDSGKVHENKNIEDLIESIKPHEEIKEIFRMFVQEIESLSNELSREITGTRVKYKTRKDFVGVQPFSNRIRLHLYFKRTPDNSDHVHLIIRNRPEAESAMSICKKAFEESFN